MFDNFVAAKNASEQDAKLLKRLQNEKAILYHGNICSEINTLIIEKYFPKWTKKENFVIRFSYILEKWSEYETEFKLKPEETAEIIPILNELQKEMKPFEESVDRMRSMRNSLAHQDISFLSSEIEYYSSCLNENEKKDARMIMDCYQIIKKKK